VIAEDGSMISVRGWTEAAGVTDLSVEDLLSFLGQEQSRLWVDLVRPTEDEVSLVGGQLGLLNLTIEDLIHQRQRAKIERFHDYLYLVMHRLAFKDGMVLLPEFDFVLSRKFLLTVQSETLLSTEDEAHLGGRLGEIMAEGVDLLLYSLTDLLVDSYFPAVEILDDTVDRLEDDIIAAPTDAVLARIFELKRGVANARKTLAPQLEIFSRLTGPEYEDLISGERSVYFRDVHDHLIRVFEVVDSYRDLLSGALDAYLSTVSNRMNDVMKRLSIVASLFLPISFLTGVFGMNFGNQPWVQGDPGYFFWIALAVMVILFVGQLVYFRRASWI
jgi:magnesium transporter